MTEKWRGTAVISLATALLGLLCLGVAPVLDWFDRLSYDLPLLFAPEVPLKDVIIVQRDEKSYRDLNQQYGKIWDRGLYVQLLDHLKRDQARLAVFDLFLSDAGDNPAKNDELAQAIRRNGRVVLAMDYREYPNLKGGEPIYPREEFKEAAAGLGVSSVSTDKADGVVRQIHPGYEAYWSLPWAAAAQAGAPADELKTRLQTARWLNYPPSLEGLRRISFSDALLQQAGYFTNKYVFIGGSPRTKLEGDLADEFATPFRRWVGERQPGVIIHVVGFLNLIHRNWLQRTLPIADVLMVVVLGILFPAVFLRMRLTLGLVIAGAILVILFAGACGLMFVVHRWCSWTIVAVAQLPFALICSAITQTRKLPREKGRGTEQVPRQSRLVQGAAVPRQSETAEIPAHSGETLTQPDSAPPPAVTIVLETAAFAQASPVAPGVQWLPPSVPDHTLVRCIGEGGYGQVWLARDVIGSYHAVKLVFRRTFDSAIPFDREFTGIHHFTPISRMHPGFVHILHVGRNEAAGYFFYIMELADDENAGQKINPDTYTAKTLSRVIRTHGRLPPIDCVKLGLELSSALEFLHSNRLIHRDIKPSNVLYVHGHAKFADVGLVTEIHTRRGDATYIGTEGYIAPEGPGTPAADVYGLGKLLYEIAMGLDRKRFPDLPTSVIAETDQLLLRLNQIILTACESNPLARYPSAGALCNDLQALLPQ
jgi:CHASE2 domain-containing sensor protein